MAQGTNMSRNTRQRILVASLLLFNDNGEPGTTTNEIADEVDISPGNLHYHFRKKALLVEALIDEFRVDAGRVLDPPPDSVSIDDFWVFLHELLELTAAYRFLFRDLESLAERYPGALRALGHFAKGLAAIFELWIRALGMSGVLRVEESEATGIGHNLAVIALFSERFDRLLGRSDAVDDAALRVAAAILEAIRPLAAAESRTHVDELAARYRS
jgi:AcrR family transcriptional regulator